jgi:hypothetical protein
MLVSSLVIKEVTIEEAKDIAYREAMKECLSLEPRSSCESLTVIQQVELKAYGNDPSGWYFRLQTIGTTYGTIINFDGSVESPSGPYERQGDDIE